MDNDLPRLDLTKKMTKMHEIGSSKEVIANSILSDGREYYISTGKKGYFYTYTSNL